MKANDWFTRIGGGLVSLAILAGCESEPTKQIRQVTTSGFLGDYSMLREGGEGEAALVYFNPKADFAAYDKIILDPVTLWDADAAPEKFVTKKDRQYLANVFHAVLWQELKEDYKFVTEPGPGTMRVRAAITGVMPSAPTLDTISTYVPPVRLLFTLATLNADTAAFVGEASVEGEVRDAQSGELLAAGVDRRAGTKFLGKASGGVGKWKDVKQAFQAWAQQFKANLRKLRGR